MPSSGNFARFNPLKRRASSYADSNIDNANQQLGSTTGNAAQLDVGFKLGDGKFYYEVYAASIPGSLHFGVCIDNADLNNVTSGKAIIGMREGGNKLVSTAPQTNSTSTSYGSSFASGGAILAVAMDFTNSTMEFFINNSSQGSFSWSSANDGSTYYPYVYMNTQVATLNTGQDSTFCGQKTAQGNTDENGFGDFYYTPPSGFLAMCSANLPTSDDIDPSQTDDDFPQKQFNAVEYTGNSTTGQSITGMGLKPDLLWCKMTSSSQNNQLFDSSRLNTRATPTPFMLRTDNISAEIDDQSQGNNNPMISSFDTDGFTLGTSGSGPNDNGRTYIAMGWRANGGVTSSNTDGSITSTVQANTKAGFSIITYTGTGANATIGHGLTKAPTFVMCKNRDDSDYWGLLHNGSSFGDATDYLTLPSLSGFNDDNTFWNDTAPTDSVIHLGTNNRVNGSSDKMVAYAWHEVQGFSAFGGFVGTGNTDGSYVSLGFRPKFVFIKKVNQSSTTYGWPAFLDIVNNNRNDVYFDNWWIDQTVAVSGNYGLDFLSNGFKMRNNNTNLDGSGLHYIYCAWADSPSKFSNAF